MDLESSIIELIINAGQSKAFAFEALACAKQGEWHKVDGLIEQSKEAANEAHKVQTTFIGLDEGCGKLPITLVMVHAQDHIMTAMLARELIEELIAIYKKSRTTD
ncbi:PTS lactose/cellobiose transporter subunit IIA [Hafnia psychrotolerans]|uniref:PTS lactose/cellobiose transporter subunit IIA n=1 Tax=Hafnia psychrotolerans TaxID=1477018 RepID=UPI00166E0985|nr:PTS lactose/cellobiose transporter subunit IIA [Hafnia psychrotolerans]